MGEVISKDGTRIAFDRTGQGPALILIGGAFSYRKWKGFVQLAELLSPQFTVINYDRRGRGDSGDTPPYAIEREIEDLEALIDEAGGSASLFGLSSGGVLALRAAAAGLEIEKLALYEPPFIVDDSGHLPPPDFAQRLDEMVAEGRRGDAARYFMTDAMGVPAAIVTVMRLTPIWKNLKATAHTLPNDFALMGDTVWGRPLSAQEWGAVRTPTLVLAGQKSPALLRNGARAIADILPNSQHRQQERQSHNVKMKPLAPVLADFFAASNGTGPQTPALGAAVESA